jgi:hypothetical protein
MTNIPFLSTKEIKKLFEGKFQQQLDTELSKLRKKENQLISKQGKRRLRKRINDLECKRELRNVAKIAVNHFQNSLTLIPNKKQAWNYLYRLIIIDAERHKIFDNLHLQTMDKNSSIRMNAAICLGSAFYYHHDKNQAWNDLIWLVSGDKYGIMRRIAIKILESGKNYDAEKYLIRLSHYKNTNIRLMAEVLLDKLFP